MKKKISLVLLSFLLCSTFLFSQQKRLEAVKQESWITYKLTHPLHEVESTSKEAACYIDADVANKQIKAVAVQVGVTSFNSGNSNRDSHAMEVVDALDYPYARFISSSVTQNGDSVKAFGKLTFHGVTKDVEILAKENWSDKELVLDGGFNISLTEFKIKRPSLLLIPVNDTLKFTFHQVFNL